jgi:hypothetical protein
VTTSLSGVAVVQGGLQKSLKKAKRKIEYVEVKLLEVRLFQILKQEKLQPPARANCK